MKYLLIFLTVFVSSFVEVNDPQTEQVRGILQPYLENQNHHNISIAMITPEGEKVYTFDAAGAETFTQLNSAYEIGSITKTFTAIKLAEQVINGSLKLEDPVSKYLPAELQNPVTQSITLQSLATHSSGLPRLATNFWSSVQDHGNPYNSYTTTELDNFLKTCEPGTPGCYSYSNVGAGLLGSILNNQSNSPYEDMIAGSISLPLGMENTNTHNNNPYLLPGYSGSARVGHWDFKDATAGQGALRSDIEDMLKYLRFNLNPDSTTVLGKAALLAQKQHFKDPVTKQRMGLGWHIGTFNGMDYYEHTGGTGGFRSFMGFIPGSRTGVVILSNSTTDVSNYGLKLLNYLLTHKA